MRDLLGDELESSIVTTVELEGFSQEWIKWFTGTIARGAEGGDGKGCHVGQLFTVIIALSGFVKYVRVLKVFGDTLDHG